MIQLPKKAHQRFMSSNQVKPDENDYEMDQINQEMNISQNMSSAFNKLSTPLRGTGAIDDANLLR